MRILVTGAAGLTAGAVVERLAASNHEVSAVVRHAVEVPGAVEVVVGDCRDPRAMTPLFRRIDALVHVAGIAHGSKMAEIEALRSPSIIIVVSSAGVYSRHRSSASTYLAGEAAIARVRPDAIFVRPTMIYGSARDRNVHHLIHFASRWGFLPLVGRGDGLVQPIHFEDLAFALAALASHPVPGTFLDAGGGTRLTVREMFATVLLMLGRPVRLIRVPSGMALAFAHWVDLARGSRWAERVERLEEDRIVDNSSLVRLTNALLRSFQQGIGDELRDMGAARIVGT